MASNMNCFEFIFLEFYRKRDRAWFSLIDNIYEMSLLSAD